MLMESMEECSVKIKSVFRLGPQNQSHQAVSIPILVKAFPFFIPKF
jgi:hypothetical protein